MAETAQQQQQQKPFDELEAAELGLLTVGAHSSQFFGAQIKRRLCPSRPLSLFAFPCGAGVGGARRHAVLLLLLCDTEESGRSVASVKDRGNEGTEKKGAKLVLPLPRALCTALSPCALRRPSPAAHSTAVCCALSLRSPAETAAGSQTADPLACPRPLRSSPPASSLLVLNTPHPLSSAATRRRRRDADPPHTRPHQEEERRPRRLQGERTRAGLLAKLRLALSRPLATFPLTHTRAHTQLPLPPSFSLVLFPLRLPALHAALTPAHHTHCRRRRAAMRFSPRRTTAQSTTRCAAPRQLLS